MRRPPRFQATPGESTKSPHLVGNSRDRRLYPGDPVVSGPSQERSSGRVPHSEDEVAGVAGPFRPHRIGRDLVQPGERGHEVEGVLCGLPVHLVRARLPSLVATGVAAYGAAPTSGDEI